jgi:protein N-terminal glutamine amidohydrolase
MAAEQKKTPLVAVLPAAAVCPYSSCYCEENVWKLCNLVRQNHPSELSRCHVVFVSNESRMVPLWRQKAGREEEKLVFWDYHVVILYQPDERCVVYDLDSQLPFPTYFQKYVTETFRTDQIVKPSYFRFFRVIPATVYLQTFSSDRSHMLQQDGSWSKPPPSWPIIQSASEKMNLDSFISMDAKQGCGEVFSLTEFVKKFYKVPGSAN